MLINDDDKLGAHERGTGDMLPKKIENFGFLTTNI